MVLFPSTDGLGQLRRCENDPLLYTGVLHSLLRKRLLLASVLFGAVVHFKIYPVIYALPIVMLLGDRCVDNGEGSGLLWFSTDHSG